MSSDEVTKTLIITNDGDGELTIYDIQLIANQDIFESQDIYINQDAPIIIPQEEPCLKKKQGLGQLEKLVWILF